MSRRMPIAQKNAVAPAASVAAFTSVCPGTYQSIEDAPPAKKATAINAIRIREL